MTLEARIEIDDTATRAYEKRLGSRVELRWRAVFVDTVARTEVYATEYRTDIFVADRALIAAEFDKKIEEANAERLRAAGPRTVDEPDLTEVIARRTTVEE
jgi:hypothetical protein